MGDPRNPNDVKEGMNVKASILKNDPPEKWITTTVKRKKTKEQFCPDGTPIILADNRDGYVKEFFEDFIELTEKEIKEMIQGHENFVFELKSSFQFSTKRSIQAECLKEEILRELSSMLNTKGGKICIGVDNKKNILGLDEDYKLIKIKKTGQPKKDSFIQELRSFINSRLGDNNLESCYNAYVVTVDSKELCIIDVQESKFIPAFVLEKYKVRGCDTTENEPLYNSKKWTFYIKTDRGTSEKNPYEALQFWKEHKTENIV